MMYFIFWFASFISYRHLPLYADDAGGLLPTAIKEIRPATTERELQQWVEKANEEKQKISIAGMQHTMGGHTFYPGAVMVDMKSYDKIFDYRPEEKLITVQSGITWEKIQKRINPDGLALKVTQSQAIFTVGGSLSANIHGRDIRYGSLYDTVVSFRLLTPQGKVIEVSRTENSEWFPYVIGGYGLFGIILDETLSLTVDELYKLETDNMSVEDYPAYFKNEVRNKEDIRMHMARISVAPEEFLSDMYVINYRLAGDGHRLEDYHTLNHERMIALPKALLGLSRYSDAGKNLFWDTQKKYLLNQNGSLISRNNVMRSESSFMEYESSRRTEVLSELFIPIDMYPNLIAELKIILENEELNVLNITIRYVEKDEQATLSYAKDDMFGLVILINQGTSKKDITNTKKVLQKMMDATLALGGTYYLPYYPYATKQQLKASYPNIKDFFQKKQEWDPNEVFVNLFYKEYN
jgi:FAD/FMN-containing dehydrogenase